MCIFEPNLILTEMNRFFNRIALVSLAITLICGQARAQFTTTYAKNASPGQQTGLYYSLPQTMLQLDFVIRETVSEKGPLSDYADIYFTDEDYVDYQSKSYELLEVRMSSKAAPDPKATFFVNFVPVRGTKTCFDVLPNGIIKSVGSVGIKEEAPVNNVEGQEVYNEVHSAKLINDPGFMPLMTAGKTNSQLAKEVADRIAEIRKSKFYLISGDVEMASDPETFKNMYAKMEEEEQQYLSLFLGKHTSREVVQTLFVVPTREALTQTVAKFSDTEGLVTGANGFGTSIVVQTMPLNTTSIINAPSPSAVESMSYENKVMYRIPETANVKVIYGNQTLIEARQTINQLGVVVVAPVTNALLMFDTKTGQIINMKMQ